MVSQGIVLLIVCVALEQLGGYGKEHGLVIRVEYVEKRGENIQSTDYIRWLVCHGHEC